MQELIETIEAIRGRINEHHAKLSSSESMTRYALIDPLLNALGWNLSDPGVVSTEDFTPGSIADYVLDNAIVVEAKKLGGGLGKHEQKLMDYTKNKNVRYGVLTDGARWKIYDTDASSLVPKEEFDIRDDTWVVIPAVAKLHKLAVRPKTKTDSQREPEPQPNTLLEDSLKVIGKKPRQLRLPDGKTVQVHSWSDMFASIVEWLLDNDKIRPSRLPITTSKTGVLLGHEPCHLNGKPFRARKKVGNFYLNTNLNAMTMVNYAIRLIQDEAMMRKEEFVVKMD